ncbi:lipid-A-disaccharide synthase [Parathermosynechococcus lividus PCC 6715]|uniref:Lipid-A-disaccharide synthase n=1 Tax=Parathermosynechococcus lividus PCC 6715 TaxID=1917166 RepID=A0A2D2PYZ6_PARLV|nr:lipid-A-disaccharide synthase [Thermostichus lividus]ATS17463.1 lipid-A-disaccharide synthase [Thermostichus lividus PCC 6715]
MAHLFISTGEVSGDLQGALLVKALYRLAADRNIPLRISALGGDRMAAAGATVLFNTGGIGSVGLLEALPLVKTTIALQLKARRYLQRHPPDLVVLIDYIGGNMAMGGFIRKHFAVPMVYYIAPQEWVWSHSLKTTRQIVALSDRLIAIFPEEAKYYRQHGANVVWVGHPLLDRIAAAPSREAARQALGIGPEELAIALLPLSRKQEIRSLLPLILGAATNIAKVYPHARFWLPLSLQQYRPSIEAALQHYPIRVTLADDSLLVLAAADLAIAKSGTVNLETALLNVPQVVIYRVNPISLWLYRIFLNFNLDFVSPPNLLAGKAIVPELLQENATVQTITATALGLLANPEQQAAMKAEYRAMRRAMGTPGVVERAATEILDLLTHH